MAEAKFDKAELFFNLPWDAEWVTAVCFVGKSRLVAAGNNRGEIMVWEVPEQKGSPVPQPARKLVGHTNSISKLVATADGRWLISASYDHTIRYWDMQAAANGAPATVTLNERARYEATQRRGAKQPDPVEVKVPTQEAARVLSSHKDWICGFSMSNDEKLLVSGDDGGKVIVWERASGKELKSWQVTGWAYAVAFSPDTNDVVVSERIPLIFDRGRHSGIRVWDRQAGTAKQGLDKEFDKMHVAAALYAPDGKHLILGKGGEGDGKIYYVDPKTGKKTKELSPQHQYGIT
ncbi:MAG: WD40 repeat domain-containing protein, partial [Gemmataceae bacterium]